MPRIVWTPPAVADLSRLHRFLADKNPDAARRAVAAIRHATRILERHPEVGRPVDGLPVEFRDWPAPFGGSAYLLRYRFDGRDVVVLGVRHGREEGFR